MRKIERSIEVEASRERVFALTQDYGRRLAWDPYLQSAELVGGAVEPGAGVRALCVNRAGRGMETEYVTFDPPRATAVKMTRGPRLLASFAGSWRFDELGPSRCRVVFRYHFKARPRWLAWVLESAMRRVFGRDMQRRLDALAAFVAGGGLDAGPPQR